MNPTAHAHMYTAPTTVAPEVHQGLGRRNNVWQSCAGSKNVSGTVREHEV